MSNEIEKFNQEKELITPTSASISIDKYILIFSIVLLALTSKSKPQILTSPKKSPSTTTLLEDPDKLNKEMDRVFENLLRLYDTCLQNHDQNPNGLIAIQAPLNLSSKTLENAVTGYRITMETNPQTICLEIPGKAPVNLNNRAGEWVININGKDTAIDAQITNFFEILGTNATTVKYQKRQETNFNVSM